MNCGLPAAARVKESRVRPVKISNVARWSCQPSARENSTVPVRKDRSARGDLQRWVRFADFMDCDERFVLPLNVQSHLKSMLWVELNKVKVGTLLLAALPVGGLSGAGL